MADSLKKIIDESLDAALARRDVARTAEDKQVADGEVDLAKRVVAANKEAEEAGCKPYERFGMQIVAMARADGNRAEAVRVIHDEYKAPKVAKNIERTLELQNPTAGGFLVPPDHLTEMIPLLRPAAAIFRLNPRFIPLVEGKAYMPWQKTGSSAGWFKEGQDISSTEPTFGQLELVAKNLGAIVYLSRFMQAARSGSTVFQVAGQDLLNSIAQEIGRVATQGTNANEPTGLHKDPLLSQLNKVSTGALPSYANLPLMVTEFMKQNPPMANVQWLFNPDFYRELLKAVSTTGQPLFRDELSAGKLFGYGYEIDNQIPSGASGHKTTTVTLADWNEFFISEFISMALEMDNSVNFKKHQTAIKGITSLDMGPRQLKAFTVSNDFWTA